MASDPVLAAYEALAPIYNDFNHRNDYEMWLGEVLLPELEKRGLRKGRALDVACGTGRAFAPLLRRGWQVRGCDLSPAMLEIARREAGEEVELSLADMRELPVYGEFELVLVLNDSIDYLLADEELESALRGIRSNMAGGGLLLFDCNARHRYETSLTSAVDEFEHRGRRWTWRGLGPVPAIPRSSRPAWKAATSSLSSTGSASAPRPRCGTRWARRDSSHSPPSAWRKSATRWCSPSRLTRAATSRSST